MSKHSPPSLFERAAEVYDFGAPLRAPAPAPAAPRPAPETPAEDFMADEPATTPVSAPAAAPVAAPAAKPIAAPRPLVRRTAPPGTAAVDGARLAAAGFIVPEGPVTGLAEEFRLLKRKLLSGIERRTTLPDEKRRIILIASAQQNEGKSFCAVNLALSLAGESGIEVLLIDGDVSKPEVPALLGIASGPGLVDALADPDADPEDFVIRTDVEGLSILPAGRKTNNVPELLASGRTREVLAKLIAGDGRRIILIDSPPALMASLATVMAGHVGQALVVVRADQTTEADLRETIGLLSGCDHVSLILNGAGVAVTGRKFGSYDGYGHDQ